MRFHHHNPRHGHGRPGTSRTSDHRTSHRRPETFSAGALALGDIHRERRVACPSAHRVQPHPGCCDDHRASTGESDDVDDPPQNCHGPPKAGVLRTPNPSTPAAVLALGGGLDGAIRSRVRTTTQLTHPSDQPTQHGQKPQWNTMGRKARCSAAPTPARHPSFLTADLQPSRSVDRG